MNKTIVCNKCGCEDCRASEILPPEEKITMKEFARLGKSPYSLPQYAQQCQRDRKWKIVCPECEYSVTFVERAENPIPYFVVGK